MTETTARARANAFSTKVGRFYELPDGSAVPSVTTFLKVLPKDALLPWAVKKTAEFAYDHQESWTGLPREAALRAMKDARFYDTSAIDAGNIAHGIWEELAKGNKPEVPEGFEGAVAAWEEFNRDFRVEVMYVEPQVISYKHGYAGSFDAMYRINGKVTLVDLKAGNGMYASVAPQLAAYANADVLIDDDGNEIPMPKVEVLAGIWLRPHGYSLRPITDAERAWRIAQHARNMFNDLKRDYELLGSPVNPAPVKSPKGPWFK